MRLNLKVKLKAKIFTVLVLVNSLFLLLVLLSLFNCLNHEEQTLTLRSNIEIKNGVDKIGDLLRRDVEKADELVEQKTEEGIDTKWKEHQVIGEEMSEVVSTLTKVDAPEVSDIIEVKNAFDNIILPSFKDIYKVKFRQTISYLRNDSIGSRNSIASNLEDLNVDFKSKVGALSKKLSRTSENLETRNSALLRGMLGRSEKEKLELVILSLFIILFSTVIFFLFVNHIFKSMKKMTQFTTMLENGNLSSKLELQSNDEIGEMSRGLDRFVSSLREIATSLEEIGQSNFTSEYVLLSDDDELGKSFLKMKGNLQLANSKALKMKEQEDLQNWATIGIAKFGEILRMRTKSNNELSYNVIKALIEYVGANQGGVFIVSEESDRGQLLLELMATYAYGRKKFKEKAVRFGEGLVGTCAIEGQSIYLTNIPDGYMEIESYLGHASPRSLLLVPLKLDDKIFGVIEIASFNEFKPHEIKFIEDLAGTIASTIATSRINQKTAELLEKSRQQSEAMLAQEEEMRQNLEELQSTQEEAYRREKILHEELDSARIEIERLKNEIGELKKL